MEVVRGEEDCASLSLSSVEKYCWNACQWEIPQNSSGYNIYEDREMCKVRGTLRLMTGGKVSKSLFSNGS